MKKQTVIPIADARDDMAEHGIDRRSFLKLMAASAALASAGCNGPPQEQIVPYVRMPEMMVPGKPVYYASAFVHRGFAQGVLIESNTGRPTKIEGNPLHPASLGATDVFAQASILQLWDPDRSQAVYRGQALSTWEAFETALQAQRETWSKDGGAGLRILTGTITSPTLADQLAALLQRYPNARWHCHDPLHDDAAIAAARLAFGKPVDTVLHLDKAAVVVAIDADLFGALPGSVRYAHDFAQRRRSGDGVAGNRLYAVEIRPTLCGARADSRLALAPAEIERLIWRVAARIGTPGVSASLTGAADADSNRWEAALAHALIAHRGESLIVAGGSMSPATRALVHAMNATLGNVGKTITTITPVEAAPIDHLESITNLAAEMAAGKVKSLVMLDANPVYDAPADLGFAKALDRVPFSVHLGLYRDETGRHAAWHLPLSHAYEHWSDARAYNGTASIVQPAIAPLYGGRSAHELVALLVNDGTRNGHALVRRTWARHAAGPDFETFWTEALRQGVIADSVSAALAIGSVHTPSPPHVAAAPLAAVFVPDPSTGAGEFANNAWLQELPRPFTKLTWDNVALIGAATAHSRGLATGDLVRLSLDAMPDHALDIPVWVLPQHAEGVISLPLGYGRMAAGRVGNGVGANTYALRTVAAARGRAALQLHKTGKQHVLATTQQHTTMEGRDIVRMATLAQYRENPHFATDAPKKRVPRDSLYPEWEYKDYKWGMAIDLNACIGCNACTIACQAENNIPTVGKEEVLRGREMHWIRVDRYEVQHRGAGRSARSVFQPVPCMHCETAPCEEVCPVGATVHDSEGLNVQVYNRCVGTRFCSNNCPYKVRRFNFLQYSNNEVESLKALQNPEVTVRRRGVMEKCTYCLQRITRARIEAEKLGRPLQDGEVVTACQAVCSTEAIVFGDLNNPNSKVNRAKASPLDYALLAELNTRPRTTYAAMVTNPDPALE